jgi:hypothetical protein
MLPAATGAVSDRRRFLASMVAGMFSVVKPGAHDQQAPVVDARVTMFHGHPDGMTSLVRFTAYGVDAPAARLRVYASGRRLVGTAGLLRTGDRLYGELWLPLRQPLIVESQLEAPGLRSIVRTAHRLMPTPRWTVVWVTAVEPNGLRQALATLPHIPRVTQAAIWREAGVRGNPLHDPLWLHVADHLSFLRSGDDSRLLESEFGIPASTIAFASEATALPHTTPLALQGAGVSFLAVGGGSVTAPAWLESADGSRVLVLPAAFGQDASTLGLTASVSDTVAQIEMWLEQLTRDPSGGMATAESPDERVALIAGVDAVDATGRAVGTLAEWNRRFAFPRIYTEGDDRTNLVLDAVGATTQATIAVPDVPPLSLPPVTTLTALARERSLAAASHTRDMLQPLAAQFAASKREDPILVVAGEIGTAFSGYLVVNPSPYRRSDTITLPNEHLRLVTDVPPIGYAFVLEGGTETVAPVARETTASTITTAAYHLEIDRKTGDIRSLRTRRDGREWVRTGGLNNIRGAILEDLQFEDIAGIGVRVTAYRWSSDLHEFRSVVTLYDSLPWIDIDNHIPAELAEPSECAFFFALDGPTVRWEIPAGDSRAQAPVSRAAHIRWVTLTAELQSVAFGAMDAPFFSARRDGTLVSYLPSGRSRIRFRPADFSMFVEDGARFGWSTVPFTIVPVTANPEGRLARFGSLLIVDQPDAAIVGLRSSVAEDSALVYVQNLSGADRFLTLGYGLLSFDDARRVDFLDRSPGEPLTSVPDGIALPSAPWGVTALRLSGLRIREG